MKRCIDITFSLLLIILTSPLLIILALMIGIAGGSVVYKQIRVGQNGKEFSMFKFRTMVANADVLGGYSTAPNDSRITKVGSVLRKTSLDELPQLFNVLLGEMSLVGPRPDVPAQREAYTIDQWTLRHTVRPGITGLAQATLRSSATWQQRYNLDIEYIKKQSILMDFKVIWLTLVQVISKGGV